MKIIYCEKCKIIVAKISEKSIIRKNSIMLCAKCYYDDFHDEKLENNDILEKFSKIFDIK